MRLQRENDMKCFSRIGGLTVLIMACTIAAIAQDSKLELPAKRHFKHNTKIRTKYDRTKDQTTVYIDPYHFTQPVSYFNLLKDVVVIAAFRHPGKTLTAIPQQIEFGIITNSEDAWFFGKDMELVAVADGKTVFSGTLEMVSRHISRNTYVEILNIVMPTETFLKIANAKTVEMKAGPHVRFKLVTDHLEAFNDLASHMRP
jgi:hypothetical protein